LLGKGSLHLLLIEQFTTVFEVQWQLLLQNLPVLLDFLGVAILKRAECLGILLLSLKKILVPLLVELLVLLDMGLLALLLLLRLVEDELLELLLIILMF
jgi:hypothetical protein